MRIRFLGAAGEVTGSCHLVEVGERRLLLDCGLFQGGASEAARNRRPLPVPPAKIDALILSHSHIDHSGRIPWLIEQGFEGPVYTHEACRALCEIMLADAGFLQEREAEAENRKRQRKGLPEVEPLYTMENGQAALSRFEDLPYRQWREILPGVVFRLSDAGHILGSSIVELRTERGGREQSLVYSGDLGHRGAPIVREVTRIDTADLVVMESTYGDRDHRAQADTWRELREVFEAAREAGGNVLIPAFAVGRTQDLLYLFAKHYDEWDLGHWQIFLDSPMAIEATAVYASHSGLYDADARQLWQQHQQRSLLPNLHFMRTTEESMALNRVRGGAIIIAGSGMCTGGRIKHHLKHNVWRRDCHVVLVGFQARGTLGRALVDGARHVRLWGETVQVAATVHTVGGLSAHADQSDLLAWYSHFRDRPPVVLVHGEDGPREGLARRLRADYGAEVDLAREGEGRTVD